MFEIEKLVRFAEDPGAAEPWLRSLRVENVERAAANVRSIVNSGLTLDLAANICEQLTDSLPAVSDPDRALNNLERFIAASRNPLSLGSLLERDRMLSRQRDELIQAERLATVGRMASHITHEIRNPLSSIGLNVEMLEEEVAGLAGSGASEARSMLQSIGREVDRLREVTEQYLRFSRLPRPDLVYCDVGAVLRDLLGFVRPQLSAAKIELDAEVNVLPCVQADANQLRQAFLNLVRNAIEAMPDGGRLEVRAAVRDEAVEIGIADSGEGISDDVRENVFQPFFTTKDAGTGLGLALTHQIVVAHGGTVTCDSAPGGGTTFLVRLPNAWSP